MSTPEQPARGPATFQAGALHVTPRPDEILATLTRVEFQILRDGEVNEAKGGRNMCLGFLGSALVGLIGLLATVDWGAAFHQVRKAPFIWTAVLFAIVVASGYGGAIYQWRYKRTRNNSAYADLMRRLAGHFPEQYPPTGSRASLRDIPAALQRILPRWFIVICGALLIAGLWVAINAAWSLVKILWSVYYAR